MHVEPVVAVALVRCPVVDRYKIAAVIKPRGQPVDRAGKVRSGKIVEHLAHHDQVIAAVRQFPGEAVPFHAHVRPGPKRCTGCPHRRVSEIKGQQQVAAISDQPGQFTHRATWLKPALVALAGQRGDCERVLAALIPRGRELPRVRRTSVQSVEVLARQAVRRSLCVVTGTCHKHLLIRRWSDPIPVRLSARTARSEAVLRMTKANWGRVG